MSRKVEIEMTVEDAKAVRAWQRAKDNIAEFDKQGQKTSKTFGTMMSDQVRGIAATAAGFAGVGSVIGGIVTAANLLRAEYDNLIQRQSQAGITQVDTERQILTASRNTIGILDPVELRAAAEANTKQTGLPVGESAQVIGGAITSTGVRSLKSQAGQMDLDIAMQSATAADIFAPDLPVEDRISLAGVAASLSKRLNVEPKKSLGFIAEVGLQSNVSDLRKQVENLGPGILSAVASGLPAVTAAAMTGALTQEGDFTGETTVTGQENLIAAVRERLGKRFAGDADPDDFRQAIFALQDDDKLRSAFVDGGVIDGKKFGEASLGKAKTRAAIIRLLTGGTTAAAQFRSNLETIKSPEISDQTFDEFVEKNRAASPALQTELTFKGGINQIQNRDEGGIGGIVRTQLAELEKAVGTPAFKQKIATLNQELESGFNSNPTASLSTTQRRLTALAVDLEDGEQLPSQIISTPFGSAVGSGGRRKATDVELADAQTLREMVAKFAEILDSLKEQRQTAQNAPVVQVNVNNRPSRAETRMLPGSRHADLTSPPAPSRVSRVGGN